MDMNKKLSSHGAFSIARQTSVFVLPQKKTGREGRDGIKIIGGGMERERIDSSVN